MVPIKCIKKCVWRNKEWQIGDITTLNVFQKKPDTFIHPKGNIITFPLPIDRGEITLLADGPSGKYYKHDNKTKLAVVNSVGCWYDSKIDYWISAHPHKLAKWIYYRKKNKYPLDNIKYITCRKIRNPVSSIYEVQDTRGSVSLYALEVLERIGFTKINLVGVDLSGRYEVFRQYWEEYQPHAEVTTIGNDWIVDWCKRKSKKVK